MTLPLIYKTREVSVLCLDCNRSYIAEEVTDMFGTFIRGGNVCQECFDEAENHFENIAFDWANDR
jgi:hypothetical protein